GGGRDRRGELPGLAGPEGQRRHLGRRAPRRLGIPPASDTRRVSDTGLRASKTRGLTPAAPVSDPEIPAPRPAAMQGDACQGMGARGGKPRGFPPRVTTLSTMAGIEQLVDDLERSWRETQERLSDPAVYNDHREAADVGRKLKELEEPFKLAQQWREASAD